MDPSNFDYANDGITRRHAHNDPQGNRFVIASEMECDALIQANRRSREAQKGAKDECFRLAARIPMPIAEKAMQQGWFHDEAAWSKWLNDPENRDFRVYEGRI